MGMGTQKKHLSTDFNKDIWAILDGKWIQKRKPLNQLTNKKRGNFRWGGDQKKSSQLINKGYLGNFTKVAKKRM